MEPQDLPAGANPCADPKLAQDFFAIVLPEWPTLTEESATYREQRDAITHDVWVEVNSLIAYVSDMGDAHK